MRYPFTPEWLDAAPEPIAERFRALEDTVIQEIARQLTQGGARSTGSGPENHASWQGKVYRWAAKPRTSRGSYPDFERVTGYGTGPGLGGWNCRHRFFPFVEGVSQRAYTDRELREIDPRPFVYQGKTYNAYEATQKQREIERTVRRLTREQKAFEAAGLSEDAQAASIRARRLRKEYREFSAAAGLKTQPERMKVLYVDEKSTAAASRKLYRPIKPSDRSGILDADDVYAIEQYKKSGVSYPLNAALRTRTPLSTNQQTIVKNLDSALEKLPVYQGTVYRSMMSNMLDDPDMFWEQYSPDNIVSYPAYTSSSTEVYDPDMDIQFVIQSKNGRDMRSYNPLEMEVIFKRNSRFYVEKREGRKIWLIEI